MSGQASRSLKREGYGHAKLPRNAECAFKRALMEYEDLGDVQRLAFIDLDLTRAVLGLIDGDGRPYTRRVRRSLQSRGLLESGEQWAPTPWGRFVRHAVRVSS